MPFLKTAAQFGSVKACRSLWDSFLVLIGIAQPEHWLYRPPSLSSSHAGTRTSGVETLELHVSSTRMTVFRDVVQP